MNNPFEIITEELAEIKALLKESYKDPIIDKNKRYSIKEAAELMKVSPLTIRNHIKRGNIKAERIGKGRKYTIRHDELFNSLNEVQSIKYKRDF